MVDNFFKTGIFSVEELEERRRVSGKPTTVVLMGQEIRTVRKAAGLSRMAIAARCGTNADQLGRFEHGIGSVSLSSLKQLCAVLNLNVIELIAFSSHMSSEKAQQTLQMAETWTGKPLLLEDIFFD